MLDERHRSTVTAPQAACAFRHAAPQFGRRLTTGATPPSTAPPHTAIVSRTDPPAAAAGGRAADAGDAGDAATILRLATDPGDIDAAAWDALLEAQAHPTPFMRHAFLAALVASGCADARTGWSPHWLAVERAGRLVAAAPAWIKAHSYGEYVFDFAWGDAYRRHGLRYWPKLLVAVPFVPVEGTRLMAEDDAARAALVAGLEALMRQAKLSSAHVLFHDATDAAALDAAGWRRRHGWQYHWTRRGDEGERDGGEWTGFLATLTRDKRKKIQQDERRVRDAGIVFEVLEGRAIDDGAWQHFMRCYERTYDEHGSTPYLNLDAFRAWSAARPEDWVMFIARDAGGSIARDAGGSIAREAGGSMARDGRVQGARIAASLVTVDRARRAAWGRWWGTLRDVPGLHFEACYHQPLRWCLANGIDRFEGGAQGEHKIARGLLPARTMSSHRIADPRFDAAIDAALARERAAVAETESMLRTHSPFKADRSAPEGVAAAPAARHEGD